MAQNKEEDNIKDVFSTPSKRKFGILNLDSADLIPSGGSNRSLFSRGVIKLNANSILNSPIKTPNGRAGLHSPEKRAPKELDKSAVKKAMKSNYLRLMDEDGNEDDENDFLTRNDMKLSEMIINSSFEEEDDFDDVQMEEDVTTPVKKRRGRPKNSPNKKSPSKPTPQKKRTTVKQRIAEDTVKTKITRLLAIEEASPDDSLVTNEKKLSLTDAVKKEHVFDEAETVENQSAFLTEDTTLVYENSSVAEGFSKQTFKKFDDKALFLDGPAGYFEQHRFKARSSNSTMSEAPVIEYSEFAAFSSLASLLYNDEIEKLKSSSKRNYHQWFFELSQGFSLNFYGVGSKREFLLEFVNDFVAEYLEAPILVINGYNPSTNLKDIINEITPVLLPPKDISKLPKNLDILVSNLVRYVQELRRSSMKFKVKLMLVVHGIDSESLRDDKTQQLLSELCSLPEIWLISSTDHINAPLLWDSTKMASFNFLWHDLTTYKSYDVELSFQDLLALGKSQKLAGTKGAKYVLTSLTSNARNLYKILLNKQIDNMNEEVSNTNSSTHKSKKPKLEKSTLRGSIKHSIEFKVLYDSCLEEFVASNEMSFRTLLGEFIEHKMAHLVRDATGQEMVFVPFQYSEMKTLLSEELSK